MPGVNNLPPDNRLITYHQRCNQLVSVIKHIMFNVFITKVHRRNELDSITKILYRECSHSIIIKPYETCWSYEDWTKPKDVPTRNQLYQQCKSIASGGLERTTRDRSVMNFSNNKKVNHSQRGTNLAQKLMMHYVSNDIDQWTYNLLYRDHISVLIL